MSEPDDPLIEWLDESYVEAYLDCRAGGAPAARARRGAVGLHRACTASAATRCSTAFERAGLAGADRRRRAAGAGRHVPDGAVPEPGGAGRDGPAARAGGRASAPRSRSPTIPTPTGSARRSRSRTAAGGGCCGDEIGWLLADHILRHTSGDDRLVITTLVSSSLLGQMAPAHGVHFAETYTGFKWIGHTSCSNPEWRFVFGYEQALGYLVCGRPLDKDGITAAVLLAEVAAVAAAEGVTLQGRLDAIDEQYGRHVMADLSVKMPPVGHHVPAVLLVDRSAGPAALPPRRERIRRPRPATLPR